MIDDAPDKLKLNTAYVCLALAGVGGVDAVFPRSILRRGCGDPGGTVDVILPRQNIPPALSFWDSDGMPYLPPSI
jgi:hypothetical protein